MPAKALIARVELMQKLSPSGSTVIGFMVDLIVRIVNKP